MDFFMLHVAYCKLEDLEYALISKDKNVLINFINEQKKVTKDKCKSQINSYNLSRTPYIKCWDKISEEEFILTANNVNSFEQLKIWLQIKSNLYFTNEDWLMYLNKEKMSNVWIEGDLSILIENKVIFQEFNNERLVEESKKELSLNKSKDIWSFRNYYIGIIEKEFLRDNCYIVMKHKILEIINKDNQNIVNLFKK